MKQDMKDIAALSNQVRQTAYDVHVYHGKNSNDFRRSSVRPEAL